MEKIKHLVVKRNTRHLIIKISLILYIIFIIYAMFLRSRGSWSGMPLKEYLLFQSNFVPFKTIIYYIQSIIDGSINLDIPLINLSANLLMFLPAGIYLPYFVKRIKSIWGCLLTILIVLILIELIQFLTRRGSFDIDDLILNMAGVAIGYLIWKIKFVQRLLNHEPKKNTASEQPSA